MQEIRERKAVQSSYGSNIDGVQQRMNQMMSFDNCVPEGDEDNLDYPVDKHPMINKRVNSK